MKKITFILITALLVVALSATAIATNRTSNKTGNWNTAGTWTPSGVPIAGDNVTIGNNDIVTVTANASCASLTMPQNANATVNINTGITLTVSGAVIIDRPNTFNVNAGTLNAASINITGGTGGNVASLNVTTGTVTVTGNITFSGTKGTLQQINFSGAGTLNVGGTFEADGTLTAGTGTVNFTGTNQVIPAYAYDNLTVSGSGTVDLSGITVTGTVTVTGSATIDLPPTVSGLTVNNSNGMTLSSATTVNGTLTFTLGNLYIGNYNLTLTGSVVGAADGKCVVTNGTGVVSRAIAAAGSFTFPVGTSARYNPVIITNNDVAVQTYTAAVVAGENPATTGDAYACNRTWNITKTGSSTADVTFTWNSADMGASCNPISCTAWRFNGTAWTEMGGYTTTGTPNTTILSNVTSFSPWTVGNSGLLPVEMTSFTAVLQGTSALLNWATATETNNSGFQIERSVEGSNVWAEVAFVAGAGTSSSPKTYSYEDKNIAPGKYIYRIKQIDNDGTTTIYNPNALPKVDAGVSNALQLGGNYPNPFNPTTNIQFSVPQDGYASLKVYNILGQEVATLFAGMAKAGHYIPATFNASRLASGIYFARLQYNDKSLVQRMLLTK